jgi:hypothetical protein
MKPEMLASLSDLDSLLLVEAGKQADRTTRRDDPMWLVRMVKNLPESHPVKTEYCRMMDDSWGRPVSRFWRAVNAAVDDIDGLSEGEREH